MAEASTDLLELLGADAAAFDFDEWMEGEAKILQPALAGRGFRSITFYTIEGDSFGPLIRGCRAYSADGIMSSFFYG